MRVMALCALLAGCAGFPDAFPDGYWQSPESGDVVEVERLPNPRYVLSSDVEPWGPRYTRIHAPGRSVYAVEGRGYLVHTAPCAAEEGRAEITFWEELRFEDGTTCPITSTRPKYVDDVYRRAR